MAKKKVKSSDSGYKKATEPQLLVERLNQRRFIDLGPRVTVSLSLKDAELLNLVMKSDAFMHLRIALDKALRDEANDA